MKYNFKSFTKKAPTMSKPVFLDLNRLSVLSYRLCRVRDRGKVPPPLPDA